MLIELVLLRHGQAIHNTWPAVDGLLVETSDPNITNQNSPLTPTGRAQVERFAVAIQELADIRAFDTFAESTLRRSQETTDICFHAWGLDALAGGRRLTRADLREREQGLVFNLSKEEIARSHPAYLLDRKTDPFHTPPPSGESIADVVRRIQPFIESLTAGAFGERVFVSTHGRVLVAVRYLLEPDAARDPKELVTEFPFCATLSYSRNPHGQLVRDHGLEARVRRAFEAADQPTP